MINKHILKIYIFVHITFDTITLKLNIMSYLLILLAVSLAVSAIGWYYFIYFFSIGYGLSITALSITTLIIFKDVITLPSAILCGVLLVYGLRLAAYLLIREKRSASYKKILYQPDNTTKKPLFVMFMIWISCALLYVGQVSPVTFYLDNIGYFHFGNEVVAWIGSAIALIGFLTETIADAQKNSAKKINANRFVDKGLYKIVRCPNYFGEILVWTGCFIFCFGVSCSVWQWIIALLGYIGIVYVMFSGARRIELRQNETYGNDPEFKSYIKKTPLIIPFLPIYSVAKYSWLKA